MLKLLSGSLSKDSLRFEFDPREITMLLLHIAVPKQASRFATFGLARAKIACISWKLTSLLILTTFVFSLLSSSIWKESLSTDAVKDHNKCEKDIALLIVFISSEHF